jgi:outer membrane immunogenic protein
MTCIAFKTDAFKTAAVSAALFAAALGSARAADMAVKAPPPVPPAVYSWTGCYIGANGGGLWAHKVWTGPLGLTLADQHVDGALGGVQGGCDYQAPNHFLIGLQGTYDWSNASGSSVNTDTTHTYTTHIPALASVTGRVGYAFNRFLGYVKGGAAWERDGYSTSILANGVIDTSASQTRSGYTFGVGGEYAFTNWLSGFIEYDYYNFGTRPVPLNRIDLAPPIMDQIRETKSVAMAGLNLHWSGLTLH